MRKFLPNLFSRIRWGPPFLKANGCKKSESGNGDDAESVYFLSVNRNKKSICLDLKSEEGRKLITEKLGDLMNGKGLLGGAFSSLS